MMLGVHLLLVSLHMRFTISIEKDEIYLVTLNNFVTNSPKIDGSKGHDT